MTTFEPFTLQTSRLALRFLTESDASALFDIYSHPEVMRYWSWPPWTEKDQAQQMLLSAHDGYNTGNALQLGIERLTDQVLIGSCSLFHFNLPSRRAEIGYILGRPYWGFGYMHEALQTLLRYAFLTLDLNRLEADIDPRNQASAKTLERLGFQQEGYLRERWIVNDEVSDTALYGLLRREWQEHTKSI